MKKITLFLCAAAACMLTACLGDNNDDTQPQVIIESYVNFEDAQLSSDGTMKGRSYVSNATNGYKFENYYSNSGGFEYNSGYTVSSLTDTKTQGYENQYSVYSYMDTSHGNKFVIYNPVYGDTCYISRVDNKNFKPFAIDIAPTTYTYLTVLNGDESFARKFNDTDSLCVIFKGLDVYKKVVSKVEIPLIYKGGLLTYYYGYGWLKFANVSPSSSLWVTIPLEKLGMVNKVMIEFESSDKGEYGINTPQYVALDNFMTEQITEHSVQ